MTTNRTTRAGNVRLGSPGAILILLAALALCFAAMVMFASPVRAGTLKVTNKNDSGNGSLRQAINTANGNRQADTIKISASGTVVLRSELPEITTDIQIVGPGANAFTVSGNDEGRVFLVRDRAKVTISGLKITEGFDRGGGIYNLGVLTVDRCTITGNRASYGGGIYNKKSRDTAEGGTLVVKNSTISGNTASGWTDSSGGGIDNDGGTLTVINSTITRNTAYRGGGIASGIYLPGQKTTIVNSTISGNSASEMGGGVHNDYGFTTIKFSTIKSNTAPKGYGGGVANDGGEGRRTQVSSSIIAGNRGTDVDLISAFSDPPNTFRSKGYNLIGDGDATKAFNARGDQIRINRPGRVIRGKSGNDTLKGTSGSDIIYGLGGKDDVRGLGGNDTVFGGGGNDRIFGQDGNDRLYGQGGRDLLVGGNGRDTLIGGTGKDKLRGGPGKDRQRQ